MNRKINLKKIKNYLNKEHEGSEGLEAIVHSPLIFITFVILLYFFFMCMTYIAYNNIANSIAQELNMRQSGYEEAITNYPTMPHVWSYRVAQNSDGSIPSGKYLSASQVEVVPYTPALKSATYFALDKYSDGFIIPFTEVTGVKVMTTKAIDPSKGARLAGTIITVNIYYESFVFSSSGSIFPAIKATGYNIIS